MTKRGVDPGEGAIEFARSFVAGYSIDEARPIVKRLVMGELHDGTDKRVKTCKYCGYYWRDDSLRNTKGTCCDDCQRGLKKLQTRQRRADQALLNPKPRKRTLMDDYIWWLEYPFWINEYSMIKIGWKFERPYGLGVMDAVEAKRELYGPGNRRKPKRVVSYHGDDRDDF